MFNLESDPCCSNVAEEILHSNKLATIFFIPRFIASLASSIDLASSTLDWSVRAKINGNPLGRKNGSSYDRPALIVFKSLKIESSVSDLRSTKPGDIFLETKIENIDNGSDYDDSDDRHASHSDKNITRRQRFFPLTRAGKEIDLYSPCGGTLPLLTSITSHIKKKNVFVKLQEESVSDVVHVQCYNVLLRQNETKMILIFLFTIVLFAFNIAS